MIFAKLHLFADGNGVNQKTIASRSDQPDSSWNPYNVISAEWLYINASGIIAIHTQAEMDAAAVSKLQPALCRQIDDAAEAQRLKYITGGAGQAAVYVEKAKQAEAYKAAGYPADASPYPLLVDEATATGVTSQVLADSVIATFNQWLTLAAAIEGPRVGGKKAINAAANVADAQTAYDTALAAIQAV